jgi:hypothetical protein
MIVMEKSIKRLKYTKGRKTTNTAKTVISPKRKSNKIKRGKRSRKPRVVNRNSFDEIIEDVVMDMQNSNHLGKKKNVNFYFCK